MSVLSMRGGANAWPAAARIRRFVVVIALGEAVKGKDDAKMADAFRALEPELEKLGAAAREVIG